MMFTTCFVSFRQNFSISMLSISPLQCLVQGTQCPSRTSVTPVLPKGYVFGLLGKTISRLHPEPAKKVVGPGTMTHPHRPEWVDQVYHPKRTITPSWMRKPMRTPGETGDLFYGVYPPDDRAIYYPSGYPWQCIGRVFAWTDASATNWSWSGSAVLVGPRVVLTARHVVPWDAKTWKMLAKNI
jgi:V8-like Glu-specific endopeptidase